MRIFTSVVVGVLCAAACSKKADGPAVAPGSGASSLHATLDAAVAMTPAGKDPWAAAPAETKTDLGAKVGGGLAKIDAKEDPWASGGPAAAPGGEAAGATAPLPRTVDIQTIEAPTAAKVEVSSFKHAGADAAADLGGFTVTYNESKNPTHAQFREVFQKEHVFETVAEGLNKTVRIPHQVQIQTVDCNTINAFYDPSSSRIIVCYELLDYFLDVFKPHAKSQDELGNSVMGATMFSFFHETGHGLIHQLDLPAVGREEDSVDQLATLILIASGDDGVKMALSGAYWFQLQASGSDKTPFWDEHGFDGQRFYNIMCLIYGSNPEKYKSFVDDGQLPPERAQKCPAEYTKINKAWEKLLEPYLTNGAAINIDYKPTVAPTEAPRTTAKDPWGDGESGDSTPTMTADPTPAAPPVAGITCEQVADKAAELIRDETYAKAGDGADREELDARLKAQLPAAMQHILAQCAKEKWPEPSRKCVLAAKSLGDAEKCQ